MLSEVDNQRLGPFMDIYDAPPPSHLDYPQVFLGSTKVTFRPSGGSDRENYKKRYSTLFGGLYP